MRGVKTKRRRETLAELLQPSLIETALRLAPFESLEEMRAWLVEHAQGPVVVDYCGSLVMAKPAVVEGAALLTRWDVQYVSSSNGGLV